MAILVDTNVLVDILCSDPSWAEWSQAALKEQLLLAPVVVNPVICAELSPAFRHNRAALDQWLRPDAFRREELPFGAAVPAARAFSAYRSRGGTKPGVLADFFIGAHAECHGHTLLTRDVQRHRTYFPSVPLICP